MHPSRDYKIGQSTPLLDDAPELLLLLAYPRQFKKYPACSDATEIKSNLSEILKGTLFGVTQRPCLVAAGRIELPTYGL
jgi:hypothetical protein